MRILRIIDPLDPRTGGPTTVFSAAVVSTAAAGANIECLTLRHGDEDVTRFPAHEEIAGRGIAIRVFAGLGEATRYLWSTRRRFDVLHVDGSWVSVILIATAIAKLSGTAIFMSPHETFTTHDMQRAKSRLRGWLKRLIAMYFRVVADRIVFSSAMELTDSLVRNDAIVIPHPVLDDTVTGLAQEVRPGLVSPGRLVLGYLGRFHPKKRLEDIIAATRATPAATLLVAGGGSDAYAAGIHASLGADEERIVCLGFLDRGGREAFFRNIDLLVLASDYECFGMAAAEAMVRGIPVIVTDRVGVATEVRDGGGFVIDVGADSLRGVFAHCLALSDEAYRALQRGALRAAQPYRFTAHGRAQVAAYRDTLRRRGRPSRLVDSNRSPSGGRSMSAGAS